MLAQSTSLFVIANPDRQFCEIAEQQIAKLGIDSVVSIFHGKFAEVPEFDCVVTAGNSFGLMDAGIDLAVVKFFGIAIQEQVQRVVLEKFRGEQPVGTSFLVATGHSTHRFVAHTPTMRVPANLNGTDNIYSATWATLLAIHNHEEEFSKIVFPAFGLGTGGVDRQEVSLQMALAFHYFLNPPDYLNGSVAQDRHEKVHYGSRWGFENPRR